MIPDDILKRINEETDIVQLVSEFVSLEKRGKNYFGLCPFHQEDTPSFSVSPDKKIAKCMGCGEGGNPINFYRKIKNISFSQAAYELGERVGIKVEYQKQFNDENEKYYEIMTEAANFYHYNLLNSVSGNEVLKYLENRGLSLETIKAFNLGYSSKTKDQLYLFLKSKNYEVTDLINLGLVKQANDGTYYDLFNDRLMFPITNFRGKTVAFSGRTLNKKDQIKYVNSPETIIFKKGEILYNINEASMEIRRRQNVVLYEGFFDVISAYQAGFPNGIATMGTALTKQQANLIKKVSDKVIIAFDGDNAGVKATISAIPILHEQRLLVEVLNLPQNVDPDDYIKKHGIESYNELLNNTSDPYDFQYNIYKRDIDINNANDIKKFQNNFYKMLKDATPAIKAIYRKRFAKDLGISETQVNIPKIPVGLESIEQKKRKKLPNRYEEAEKRLLILMMRSRIWHERIIEQLTVQEYSNTLLGGIRTKLSIYYEDNFSFDLNDFLNILNEEELNYFNEEITKDYYWTEQIKLEENEIYKYIKYVKATPKVRRIEYLKQAMLDKYSVNSDIILETEEYNMLKRELDKLKEE